MDAKSLVLVRANTVTPRLLGALFVVVPTVAAVLLFRVGGLFSFIGAAACALFAASNLRANWQFAGRVELRDARLFVRALWTGAEKTHDARALVSVRAVPELLPGSTPEHPRAVYRHIELGFGDGRVLVVQREFGEVEAFVTRVLAEAFPAFEFPMRLGDAMLVGWVRYPEASLGASASYSSPSGGLASLFSYACADPRGAEEGAEGELARACADLHTANAQVVVKELESERGSAGEGSALAMHAAAFVCGEGAEAKRMRVYVGAHRGAYLKVRSTQPAAQEGDVGEALVRALRGHLA